MEQSLLVNIGDWIVYKIKGRDGQFTGNYSYPQKVLDFYSIGKNVMVSATPVGNGNELDDQDWRSVNLNHCRHATKEDFERQIQSKLEIIGEYKKDIEVIYKAMKELK